MLAMPTSAIVTYITATDTETNTTYFVEPFKSEFSGRRLWKAYCVRESYDTVGLAPYRSHPDARRFASVTLAKQACQTHATFQDWQDGVVGLPLTHRQCHLVHAVLTSLPPIDDNTDDSLRTLENKLETQCHLRRRHQTILVSGPWNDDAETVSLSAPEMYFLHWCLSHCETSPPDQWTRLNQTDKANLSRLRKTVVSEIAARERGSANRLV